MTTFSTLAAITFTAAEQSAVAAAVGSEDAQGTLSSVNGQIAEVKILLNRLATYVPAGANLTAIQAAVTALA